jgi:hypothetical protein
VRIEDVTKSAFAGDPTLRHHKLATQRLLFYWLCENMRETYYDQENDTPEELISGIVHFVLR